jgi:hypothetical protein
MKMGSIYNDDYKQIHNYQSVPKVITEQKINYMETPNVGPYQDGLRSKKNGFDDLTKYE